MAWRGGLQLFDMVIDCLCLSRVTFWGRMMSNLHKSAAKNPFLELVALLPVLLSPSDGVRSAGCCQQHLCCSFSSSDDQLLAKQPLVSCAAANHLLCPENSEQGGLWISVISRTRFLNSCSILIYFFAF